MIFFYPISNYINKKCKVSFIDGTSKEGILTDNVITEGYKYKISYKTGCVLFNSNNVKWIDIIHA